MAILVLEYGDRRMGGTIRSRVLIGRRNHNHIVIPDRTVSRIHAWIGKADDGYFIADTGSRSGTRVNYKPVQGRHPLSDGDLIGIGAARITFHRDGPLPEGAATLDLSDKPISAEDGIFIDCECGAPLWAPWDFGGRVGQCKYCGQMVALPHKNGKPKDDPSSETMYPGMASPAPGAAVKGLNVTALNAPPPKPKTKPAAPSFFDAPVKPLLPKAVEQRVCGACQSPVSLLEETIRCPDCGVLFHVNCWEENRGCSSYGCAQVNVLDAKAMAAPEPPPEPAPQPVPQAPNEVPWELLTAVGSVLCALVGALAFGAPSLLLGIGLLMAAARGKLDRRNGLLLLTSLAACAVGLLGGIAFSWYWWIKR